jgi:hypothetical protein
MRTEGVMVELSSEAGEATDDDQENCERFSDCTIMNGHHDRFLA